MPLHDPVSEPLSGLRRDEPFMRRALELARLGQGSVEPNPMVGCVLVREGAIIGEGYHQRFGGPHAEIEAIRSRGSGQTAGATAYVSLEPCCHHGKTPPCTDALIGAKVARVVVAMRDPFPNVAGGGLAALQAAGIEVASGVLIEQAMALNAPYRKRLQTGKPWVIAKWAMTIDGRIATATGESQWITSEASRADVHRLRGRVDAIAVGMGTVLADDPMLNARADQAGSPALRLAHRVVFCRHRLPPIDGQLARSAREIPLHLVVAPTVDASHLGKLQALGAKVISAESDDPGRMVDTALDHLAHQGMTNVMVEGGSALLASFMAVDQIDECQIYLGPRLFGGTAAPGPIGGVGVDRLSASPTFAIETLERIGEDVKVVYRRPAVTDATLSAGQGRDLP